MLRECLLKIGVLGARHEEEKDALCETRLTQFTRFMDSKIISFFVISLNSINRAAPSNNFFYVFIN